MLHLSFTVSASFWKCQANGDGELNSKVQNCKQFWKAGDYELSSIDELVKEEADRVDEGDDRVDADKSICKIVKEYRGNLGKNW